VKLTTCSACSGFVPPSALDCPHCKTKARVRLGAVATVLGSGAIAFTLMACYGAAPCAEGNHCHPNTPTPDTSATPNPPATPDAGK
jgi:hypothetical protein